MKDEAWRVQFAQVPLEYLAEMTGNEFKVHYAMLALSHGSSLCWAGRTLLAEITGLDKAQVRRCLLELEKKGIWKCTERVGHRRPDGRWVGPGRGKNTNTYKVQRCVREKGTHSPFTDAKRGRTPTEKGTHPETSDSNSNGLRPDKMMTRDNKDADAKDIAYRGDASPTTDACPTCGGRLLIRNGPYGQFLGCEHYHAGCEYRASLPKHLTTDGVMRGCYDCETLLPESECELAHGYPVPGVSRWRCRDAQACKQRARKRRADVQQRDKRRLERLEINLGMR